MCNRKGDTMGIDAMMEVRLARVVERSQVRRWAWELARLFGAHSGPGNANVVRVDREETPWVCRALELTTPEREVVYPYPPEPTMGTLIKVNLIERYYGPGYERGDGHFLILCAQWLEAVTSEWGGKVYYGGDSGGAEEMKLFDGPARARMWRHLLKFPPYHTAGGSPFSRHAPKCAFCEQPMGHYLSSGDEKGYSCPVCEEHVIVRGGKVISGPTFGDWPVPYNRKSLDNKKG
jgi:hypothetical protein